MDITKLVDDVVNRYMDEIMISDLLQLNQQKIDKVWIKKSLLIMFLLQQEELGAHNIAEPNQTFSIKEIFEKYLVGKKLNEFYDGYSGGKRRSELPSEKFTMDLHLKQIYKQLDSTFKLLEITQKKLGIENPHNKFDKEKIPASAIPNLLFYLKEYYHPVMKAFRNDKYIGLTENDWKDFSDKATKYANSLGHNQNATYAKLAAETIFNNTYYQASKNLVSEISEAICDDLMQVDQIGDLAFRLKVLDIYNENIKKAIIDSRDTVKSIVDTMQTIHEDFAEELIDLEIKGADTNLASKDQQQIEHWMEELLSEANRITRFYDKESRMVDTDLKKVVTKILMRKREEKLKSGRNVGLPINK